KRAPGEALESLLEARQRLRPGRLAAVDGPTGLCADSGRMLGQGGATASLTWSIGLLKRGFLQDRALARVGRLERLDLNLPPFLLEALPPTIPLGLRRVDAASAPAPVLDPAAAKYGRGRALLVVGSRRYRGAAALSLAGASASGCGSLRVALPEEQAGDLWMIAPHAVLEAGLPSDQDGALLLAALPEQDWRRLDALLLGPGLGSQGQTAGTAAEDRLWSRLLGFPGLLVLDADGLNRLACRGVGRPEGAAAWLRQRQGPTWITPHSGEFRRLFPGWADLEPLQAASEAAAASGAAVLLKGARSVVAAPDGRLWQMLESDPQAARAGLGDVLAGYAAGRGAMALAGEGMDRQADAALLAAVALEHAWAGSRAVATRGRGGATPQAIARELEKPWPG
ncbi:MAG: NAD(P)H-hydrate dehydratase, partial [Cyanobium sp.]